MTPIDPAGLRVRSRSWLPRPPRPRRGERFLKGPVPLPWLQAAAALPGKSLHAGIAIWYSAGLARSSSVLLSNVAGEAFGMDRNAKYRALAWLEKAGLIKVERRRGRSPTVTIVHANAGGEPGQPRDTSST